ncbi:MAG TPA: hypothetical protein VNN62_17765 [Methylomirabilota bacterium]|nr:hypothetical protein [Methylomirabilota bacterium]
MPPPTRFGLVGAAGRGRLAASLGLQSQGGWCRRRYRMGSVRHSERCVRLGAAVAFLAYLLAGVSFALPAEMRCLRCARGAANHVTMKPGVACPLNYHQQHCHHGHSKTSTKITLCPDGCLRHDGQEGGEIPALAKFLASPPSLFMVEFPLGFVRDKAPRPPLDPLLPPLTHPPSFSV